MAEFTDEDDALLEELGVEVEAKATAAARRARNASSPASRKSSASSTSTGARRSTAKIVTFSSGCTPCAWIACAGWQNAGLCLSRLDRQGLLDGAEPRRRPAR